MAVAIDDLRRAATRFTRARSLLEARVERLQTVFVSHSHHDRPLVKGVVRLLEECGWLVYVDWADPMMPEVPNRETAARIKERIVYADYFLFLATLNSRTSRWCPWEIGYADGRKHIDTILILPTRDGSGTHGSEYLELYRRIDMAREGGLGVWSPGETSGRLIESLSRESFAK